MDGTSLIPEQEKLNALKQVLPEVFAEGKVDWEKLKATLGEDINFSNERYVLNWAGKSEAFKVLQAPTTKTLVPAKDESVNFDETEHIFIEGENLEVLKVLQKSYFGKVKMIYIDPPYNTGNDSFIYPDKFSETKADYEKRVGDKDEEGYMTKSSIKFPSSGGVPQAGWSKNSKENGQYHSNWLNMMMPRLYLAKNLLKQDGVIFVSIDDNEVHNLRLLMNEIFGEENFVAQLIWQKIHSTKNDAKYFSDNHEYLLCYGKLRDSLTVNLLPRTEKMNARYKNPDNDPRGNWASGDLVANEERKDGYFEVISPISGKTYNVPQGKHWVYSQENLNRFIKEGRIWFGNDGKSFPRLKRYLSEVQSGKKADTLWFSNDVGHNQEAKRETKKLFDNKVYFDTPKPIRLLSQALMIGSNKNDIILDFFSGSGTTAHAVIALNAKDGGNRKSISVQLPELCDEKSEAHKAGYKTIADIAKERIRRAGKKIAEELKQQIDDLKAKIKKLESELPTEETKAEIESLKTKIEQLQHQDLGFKVLKLEDSNFKQWQQFPSSGGVSAGRGGKTEQAKALEEQMKLFVDPVAKNATTENMVYELLLKSGKDLNAKIFPSYGGVAESRGGKNRNAQNYFELPYNPKLKERARELRKAGNLSEVLFWNEVKNKQFKGFDFDRQKIIGNYIVDFFCTNCNVVIEIDGSSHDDKVEYDAERDAYLEGLGLTVIHIPLIDVMKNMNGVMQMLFDHPSLKGISTKVDHPALKGNPPEEGNLKPNYYVINDGELVLILEKANQEIIDAVIASKPQKVIALDKLFKGNDQLKTNTVLQMKDAGIEFKTI